MITEVDEKAEAAYHLAQEQADALIALEARIDRLEAEHDWLKAENDALRDELTALYLRLGYTGSSEE